MSEISTVDLNVPVAKPETTPDALESNTIVVEQPASVEIPETAADIDTDELEALLTDIKKTKKLNKTPPKPRVRKPKVISVVEEAPVVVDPVAPAAIDPVAEEAKAKRKYIRKPKAIPVSSPEPVETATPTQVEEPTKRTTGTLIEEMQRAERALRYQMRKNKMQTLVSHAF